MTPAANDQTGIIRTERGLPSQVLESRFLPIEILFIQSLTTESNPCK